LLCGICEFMNRVANVTIDLTTTCKIAENAWEITIGVVLPTTECSPIHPDTGKTY